MLTNTLTAAQVNAIPHKKGQKVKVEYYSDSQQKRVQAHGTIIRLIGYGHKYTINILLDDGMIVTEAASEEVILL